MRRGGPHTIHVVGGAEGESDLPFLVDPVTIDGFTQPDSQPNTHVTGAPDAMPTIELDGSGDQRLPRRVHQRTEAVELHLEEPSGVVEGLATAHERHRREGAHAVGLFRRPRATQG